MSNITSVLNMYAHTHATAACSKRTSQAIALFQA
jgi:hypothetical protein